MKTIPVLTSFLLVTFCLASQAEFRSNYRLGRFRTTGQGPLANPYGSPSGLAGSNPFATSGLAANAYGNPSAGFGGRSWGGRDRDGDGDGHGPGGRGGRHHQALTPEQQAAFDQCVAANGVTVPTRPQITDAERQQMETCRGQQSQVTGQPPDVAAFQSCMAAAGFTPPARPSSDQMAALHACRLQVLGK